MQSRFQSTERTFFIRRDDGRIDLSPKIDLRLHPKAPVQKRKTLRRRFKRAAELTLKCGSDVIVAVRIQKSGQLETMVFGTHGP
jgi:hypothetical protein